MFLNLVALDTPYPNLWDSTGVKGGWVVFWRLSSAIWQKFYNTTFAEHPQLSGGGSPFWPPNPDMEGLGPRVLLGPWTLNVKESL